MSRRVTGLLSRVSVAGGTSLAAPPEALAAGFSSLSFRDDFGSLDSIDLADTGKAGYGWYTRLPFEGGSKTNASCLTVGAHTDAAGVRSDSVLTINQDHWNWNQALYSVHQSDVGQSWQYGYFEARLCYPDRVGAMPLMPMQDVPASVAGWPSWWSVARRHITGNELKHTDGSNRYLELDFHEFYSSATQDAAYGGRLVGTVHDWYSGTSHRTSDGDQYGPKIDDVAKWHTYGCLWEPGRMTWFLDGVKAHSIAYSANAAPVPNAVGNPAGTFAIADTDTQGVALALGTGNGYPMHVDWVRVWR